MCRLLQVKGETQGMSPGGLLLAPLPFTTTLRAGGSSPGAGRREGVGMGGHLCTTGGSLFPLTSHCPCSVHGRHSPTATVPPNPISSC